MPEIEIESDSLKIDIYDNGVVDGDSISVFYNDKLIAFNRILSTQAIHIDLLLDAKKEISELSMFADNLGSIPPNTALMVVSDGKTLYEIRLSGSFNANGTVRIKRKAAPPPQGEALEESSIQVCSVIELQKNACPKTREQLKFSYPPQR